MPPKKKATFTIVGSISHNGEIFNRGDEDKLAAMKDVDIPYFIEKGVIVEGDVPGGDDEQNA